MIRQRFTLPKYGWSCMAYYAVDTYYTEEILDNMHSIGCDGDMLRTAYDNIKSGNLNTGVTYSNFGKSLDCEPVLLIGIHKGALFKRRDGSVPLFSADPS